ncbi:MAG: hypothetical protein ACRDN9_08185 [Streptosporangiaceae bacterium]
MGRDRESHADRDVLTSGSEGPPRWGRLPSRWRVRGTVALAFCVGLALGGYGVHNWAASQHAPRVRFEAGLYMSQASVRDTAQVGLRLRNLSRYRVTVDRVRMDVPGFAVESGGLHDPQTVIKHGSAEVWYVLSPICSGVPTSIGTVRLRVHRAGGDKRWVATHVLLGPSYALASLTNFRVTMCHQHRHLHLRLTTIHVSRRPDGSLTLRLRLGAATRADGEGGRPPSTPRLAQVRSHVPGARVWLTLPERQGKQQSVPLPAVAVLHVQARRCGVLRQSTSAPLLHAELETSSGRTTVYVTGDLTYTASTLEYFADRCARR